MSRKPIERPDRKAFGITIYSSQHFLDRRPPSTVGITLSGTERTPDELREDASELGRFYFICLGRAQYRDERGEPGFAARPVFRPRQPPPGEEGGAEPGPGAAASVARLQRRPYIPQCKGVEFLIAESMARQSQLQGVTPSGDVAGPADPGEDAVGAGAAPPPRGRLYPGEASVRARANGVGGEGDSDDRSLSDRAKEFAGRYWETLQSDVERYRNNLNVDNLRDNAINLVYGVADVGRWAKNSVVDSYTKMREMWDQARKEAEAQEAERKRKRGG